jgi:CheY-like chemotaxis protein
MTRCSEAFDLERIPECSAHELREQVLSFSSAASIKHRILCVDDEIVGARIRGEILEEHGYSVVLFHCPLAALRCDLSLFDLAVLDFQMPRLNGRELFLRMRAFGVRYPIVLLTGCLETLSHEERVLFARCLDKSLPVQCLLDTIAEFLGPAQVPDFGTEASVGCVATCVDNAQMAMRKIKPRSISNSKLRDKR